MKKLSGIVLGIIFLMVYAQAFGQLPYTIQFNGQFDNDQFAIKNTDRYYTNGFIFNFQKLTKDTLVSKSRDFVKQHVVFFNLAHKIYTPKNIWFYSSSRHDRPYASLLVLDGGLQLHYSKHKMLQADLNLGLIGSETQGESIQQWWHKQVDAFVPRGWENQIASTPIINGHILWASSWWQSQIMQITSMHEITLGTTLINTRQFAFLQFGRNLRLSSSFLNKSIINTSPIRGKMAWNFFMGLGIEYVYYNALLEGGKLGLESPFIVDAYPFIFHTRYGIMCSMSRFDFAFAFRQISKEMQAGLKHQHLSINLGIRI